MNVNAMVCEGRIVYLVTCNYWFESAPNIMACILVLVWPAGLSWRREGDGAVNAYPRPWFEDGGGKGMGKFNNTAVRVMDFVRE